MDSSFMGEMVVSMLIFAPGLILLTVLAVVGVLMILEKTGVFSAIVEKKQAAVAMAGEGASNPAPSKVVSGLKGAIESEVFSLDGTAGTEKE